MRKPVLIFCLYLIASAVSGNLSAEEYYVSNRGNDKADGTTPETSFKSLQQLNQLKLKPGDKVFLKAGDTFTGTLKVNKSGKPGNPIVISSYGKGEKPVISGAVVISNFISEGDHVYSATCNIPIKSLYRNDSIMICARYPNSGFLYMDETGGEDYLVDNELAFEKDELAGATVRVHVHNWYYDHRTITGNESGKIYFNSLNYEPNLFRAPTGKKGFDYYLDNKKAFLDTANEWYYSPEAKKLYIYSDQPLSKQDVIKGSYINTGLVIEKGVSHIQIKNLGFYGQAKTGILALGDNSNIEIDNNYFQNISEVGIYTEKSGSNFTISNNSLNDISGGAIKLYHINNSLIENNHIERIGLIAGYGRGGLDDANGICILNYEIPYKDSLELSHHNIVRSNYIENIGYDGIRFDGHSSVCDSNIIKNTQLTLHDGGGIYCSVHAFKNSIKNNIIISDKALDKHLIALGIYLDFLARDILVEGNIICNYNGGIMSNMQAYDNNISNNLIYNCHKAGILVNLMNEQTLRESLKNRSIPFKIRGYSNPFDTVTGNTIVNMENQNSSLTLANHRGTYLKTGLIDSNLYVSPNEKFHIRKISVSEKQKKVVWNTLEGWQEETGKDKNSTCFSPKVNGKKYPMSDIFINENDTNQTFTLDPKYEYIDLEGTILSDDIILEARKAKVVFYKLK